MISEACPIRRNLLRIDSLFGRLCGRSGARRGVVDGAAGHGGVGGRGVAITRASAIVATDKAEDHRCQQQSFCDHADCGCNAHSRIYSTPHTMRPAMRYFPSALNEQGSFSQFGSSFTVNRRSSRPLGTSISRAEPSSALIRITEPSSLNFIGSPLLSDAFIETKQVGFAAAS